MELCVIAWVLALLLVCCSGETGLGLSIPDTDTTTTYSSILPQEYAIGLSYIVDGEEVIAAPCYNYQPGASCLVTLQADQDSVKIRYTAKPGYQIRNTSTARIQMCYGLDDTVDRPWREFDNVISANKQCNLDIADELPPQGEYTYFLSENIATSVYAVEVINVLQNGTYAAFGNSSYFQVDHINDTPPWLVGTASGLAALGPILLVGFFLREQYSLRNMKQS